MSEGGKQGGGKEEKYDIQGCKVEVRPALGVNNGRITVGGEGGVVGWYG